MNEVVEGFLSELRSALRFRWYGIAAAWLICLVGWAVVAWLPDVFESRAIVYVDTSSILQPLLGDQIVAQDVDAQVEYVKQSLLGTEQLDSVIRTVGLDQDVESATDQQKLLAKLRKQIQIQRQAPGGSRRDSTYTISYRNKDRDKAVGVVRTLLNAFIGDTLGADRAGSKQAQQFLDERIGEYEGRLRKAEQALADFKKQHADRLPGAEGDYFTQMQAEKNELEAAEKNLRVLEAKHDQLISQLQGAVQSRAATALDDKQLPKDSIEARLRDYKAQLDAARLKYTDRHPDVIALKETVARLEAQRAEQLRDQAANIDKGIGGSADPVTQAAEIALNENKVEMAAVKANLADRKAKVAQLQSMIDEVPEVEAQLAQLNRDYDVVHRQYLDLVKSRETQQLTEKASAADTTHFRIIDPPIVPELPVAPRRLLLLIGVFVAALGGGAVLCWALGQVWPVFSSARTLQQRVELPVLGTVAYAWQDRRRQQRRRAVLAFAGALSPLFLIFAAVVVVQAFGSGVHRLIIG